MDITVPAGATGRRHRVSVDIADADNIGELSAVSGSDLAGAQGAPGAGGADTYMLLTYIVVNSSTAGNVQLRWAQNVAHASNTRVFANSYLKASRF